MRWRQASPSPTPLQSSTPTHAPVLLLDVRSDICTITEHVRKKLEALPYKVVEPHGATADKRFPKLLEHLRRGGKERAAVLSTAKTERRSPRGRGGESLPGFFYLTDRKLYYTARRQPRPTCSNESTAFFHTMSPASPSWTVGFLGPTVNSLNSQTTPLCATGHAPKAPTSQLRSVSEPAAVGSSAAGMPWWLARALRWAMRTNSPAGTEVG